MRDVAGRPRKRHLMSMRIALTTIAALTAASATAQVPTIREGGRPMRSVPQNGVVLPSVPQRGVILESHPQTNPDGSRPRIERGWRPPVTVIIGDAGADYIAFPAQVNLPNPAPGLVWRRIGRDAVLYDPSQDSILEVRSHWFG